MAGVHTMISVARQRPPPIFGINCCETTPCRTNDNVTRICSCWLVGKYVDDTVDRFGAGVGVQGGKGQVPGFGNIQRLGDRLQVAHFTHQHHVGVLPQRVLERDRERAGIRADFALVDQAVLVAVEVFDRDPPP